MQSKACFQTETIFDRSSSGSDMANVEAKREISSAESEESSREAKRAKGDNKNGEETGNEPEWKNILSTFTTSSVLSDSAREKIMFLHGKVFFSLI